MLDYNKSKTENCEDNDGKPCWRDPRIVAELLRIRIKFIQESENDSRDQYRQALRQAADHLSREDMSKLHHQVDIKAKAQWKKDCAKNKIKIEFLKTKSLDCTKHPHCHKINTAHLSHTPMHPPPSQALCTPPNPPQELPQRPRTHPYSPSTKHSSRTPQKLP